MHRSLITITAFAALTVPATAEAASVHYEGPEGAEVLVVTGAPGERNLMSIQDHDVDGAVTLYDAGVSWTTHTPYCSETYNGLVCPAPNGLRVEAGDSDDWITVSDGVIEPIHLVGGAGDDRLEGEDGPDVIDGGDGQDRVSGLGGDDVLDGGAGSDVVDGYSGRDIVRGGDGDDTLHGDGYESPAADVIDGGAGVDTIESDYSTRMTDDPEPLLHITLAGGADDGRPGENDDIRNVERLVMSKGGTYIGSEGSDYVKLHQVGDDGVLDGRGGDDELRGGDGRDRIDAGHGNDRVDAGFGDDTIEVRDGEVDSVSCGPGTDAVVADAADTIATDCEQVDRAGPTQGKAKLTVRKPGRLKRALREGLRATLTGYTPARYTITARLNGKVIASRRVTVGATGTATARLRFTRRVRRSLVGRRQVTLVMTDGSLTRKVRLSR